MNVPDAVGVPLIVITLDAQAALTPDGKPVGEPIPVALVVLIVILAKGVLIHKVGVEEGAPAVFVFTVTLAVFPLWGVLPQLLVKPTEFIVIPEVGPVNPLILKLPVLVVVPVKFTVTVVLATGLVVL